MFGLRWFGPKQFGYGIGPRTWQAWVVIAVYSAVMLWISTLNLDRTGRHELFGIATGVLIAIVAFTYRSD